MHPQTGDSATVVPDTRSSHSPLRNLDTVLQHRLSRPQRHRLLHGFPLAAAMPFASDDVRKLRDAHDERFVLRHRADRELLLGVLPHSFCNPAIAGCGFCTFPHEKYSSVKAASVVNGVIQEINSRVASSPHLRGRSIAALYFGGGTANLTPAVPFRRLCRSLSESFDLSEAEVSLEGVPVYFVSRKSLLLDILADELSARHFRISMGIQTFSRTRLEQMGRMAFGGSEVFAEVVKSAHARGMTVSADLLINLPGQSVTEMKDDVAQAVNLGLDQICLYHLVLFRGMAAPWSQDAQMLATLPDNETSACNWDVLREYLLACGYRQTTLTNFERCDLQHDPRRYLYELMSFQPDRFDVLGFGPSGISCSEQIPQSSALKTMNPESAVEYLQAVHRGETVWNRYYEFSSGDLKLLHATRQLSSLKIDRRRYQQALGSDVVNDYAQELEVLQRERLLDVTDAAVSLTTRGMFYADSVAAVLAHRQLGRGRDRRTSQRFHSNDNSGGHM
ncbi:MAG: Oxygen-independent coproporphyrinogen-III oxidase 1 [Planctomycetota bacterium]|jgi:coproporphyrinogen III oxidase-like Fe-S oxidoreductase